MNMRAKMVVSKVTKYGDTSEVQVLDFNAVSSKPFDANGDSEDNTYARWTPSGTISLTVTNPALLGQYKEGDVYYVDFTKASE